MWKLKTEKAYSLLEVMIAVSIFTILTFSGFSIYTSVLKQKSYNNKLKSYLDCMEVIGSSLQVNYSYSELTVLLGSEKRYINDEYINIQALCSRSISSLLISMPEDPNNYISIQAAGSDVLKITLQGKFSINGKVENITSEVYKGCYN